MKKFSRNIEDFICFNCKNEVKGNGYTNHCPICLWSLHVDINPGDRENICLGHMKPVGLKKHKKGFQIIFECQSCRELKNNKVSEFDDKNTLFSLPVK